MAMIICPECNKRFSDKAMACPECGCPTASIVKKAVSSDLPNRVKCKAEEAMLSEVSKAKHKADAANRLFERRSSAIQSRASRNYDLFSSDTTSSVVGIVADVTRTCDDLYSSLQALVMEVDSICRPYLSDRPSSAAIKAVADLEQLTAEIVALKQELSEMGALHIWKKREQKEAIRMLDAKLAKLSDQGLLETEKSRLKQRANEVVSQYSKSVEQYLDMRFPNRHCAEKLGYKRSIGLDVALENSEQASLPCPEPPKPSDIFDGQIKLTGAD